MYIQLFCCISSTSEAAKPSGNAAAYNMVIWNHHGIANADIKLSRIKNAPEHSYITRPPSGR